MDYNTLEKDVLIEMLIECNRQEDLTCQAYQSGAGTSGVCIYCGKYEHEHPAQKRNKVIL